MERIIKAIAHELNISIKTLNTHHANIKSALGVHRRLEILRLPGNEWKNAMCQLKLTPRGKEVFCLILEGLVYRDIAKRLGITRDGVKRHVEKMLLANDCAKMFDLIAKHREVGMRMRHRQELVQVLDAVLKKKIDALRSKNEFLRERIKELEVQ